MILFQMKRNKNNKGVVHAAPFFHCLNIEKQYFDLIKQNRKQYELRRDRNFKVNDYLFITNNNETIIKRVVYVLRNVEQYGLMKGYVILSF